MERDGRSGPTLDLHGPALVALAEPGSEDETRDGETRPDELRSGSLAPARPVGFSERYEMLGMLGAGGMGEVRLCRDRVIGREVAMKVVRSVRFGSPHRWRFVREARVQGQLEHPSVVPVYDLGLDPDGYPYFTMRRVHGVSLTDVVRGLASGDPATHARYSLRRRLSIFSRLCLCMELVHSRGVVHRDLKPGNVMLGEYGEVYVLDWGLVKILGDLLGATPSIHDASNATPTGEGSVLGTPGYMSPEQLRGEVELVGPWSDVYSLGAILFELLAIEPLHAQIRMQDKLISNLSLDGARPRQRAPRRGIPEVLDALCERALRLSPRDRFQSAGGLSEVVEAYLDSLDLK